MNSAVKNENHTFEMIFINNNNATLKKISKTADQFLEVRMIFPIKIQFKDSTVKCANMNNIGKWKGVPLKVK